MNTKIRLSIFETNSSSTHSLTIKKDCTKYDTIPFDDDYEKTIILDGGEFGWEIEDIYSAKVKANYCAVCCLYYEDNPSYIDRLINVIEQHTGAKEVLITCTINIDPKTDSYIDHQSVSVALDVLKSEEELRNFIFNPNCILHIDNDND